MNDKRKISCEFALVKDMKIDLKNFGAALVDDRIIIYGGWNGTESSSSLQVLHYKTGTIKSKVYKVKEITIERNMGESR